jgi:hypothetical protein
LRSLVFMQNGDLWNVNDMAFLIEEW